MIRLGSVNLIVRDMAAAERFYVEVLGLTVDAERTNRPSFVLLQASNCMIILQDAKAMGEAPEAANAVELGFEVDDVAGLRTKLADRAMVQQMGWGEAIETRDPAGTRLNLYRMKQGDR